MVLKCFGMNVTSSRSCEITALMSPQSGLQRGPSLSLLGCMHGAWWLCFAGGSGPSDHTREIGRALYPVLARASLRRVSSLEPVNKENLEGI